MGIVLARIDDRLIHGQVMTSWLNYTGAGKIVVIDDATAKDSFLSMIIKTLVPANIKTEVTTLEKSVEVVAALPKNEKVILLSKTPEAYVNLVKNGIALEKINIGGMGARPGRKTLYRNISASEEEMNQLKELTELGLAVEIQMVAEDTAINVKKYLS
ncbi:PTS sugar transporter subunit IIB [Faecalicatena orotica]|nr:PTS sugar transporter subunit IIB [Faecalicatena orotica]SCH52148.1 Sorbose-specific phosphotransferase enzyme IIB component [uncultured Clostridium sp.]